MEAVQQEDIHHFWGPVTSPLDWCERNYIASGYIAEFFNTITNAAYVVAGVVLLQHVRAATAGMPGGDADFSQIAAACFTGAKIDRRDFVLFWLKIASVATVFTGIFSATFHASLQYSQQKLDESFENIILIALMHAFWQLGLLLESMHRGKEKSVSRMTCPRVSVLLFLVDAAVVVTLIFFVPQLPTAEVSLIYRVLHVLIGLNDLIKRESLADSQQLHSAQEYSKRLSKAVQSDEPQMVSFPQALITARKTLGKCLLSFAVSGAAWLIDFTCCKHLEKHLNLFDSYIWGVPHLHAFGWHIFSALALFYGHLCFLQLIVHV